MENDFKKQVFVELRSSGLSFAEISKEIDVSKPTLIKWSRELSEEVHTQKVLLADEMRIAFKATKLAVVEKLLNLSSQIDKELEKRQLSDIPTEKLIKLRLDLQREVESRIEVKMSEFIPQSPGDIYGTVVEWNID